MVVKLFSTSTRFIVSGMSDGSLLFSLKSLRVGLCTGSQTCNLFDCGAHRRANALRHALLSPPSVHVVQCVKLLLNSSIMDGNRTTATMYLLDPCTGVHEVITRNDLPSYHLL